MRDIQLRPEALDDLQDLLDVNKNWSFVSYAYLKSVEKHLLKESVNPKPSKAI